MFSKKSIPCSNCGSKNTEIRNTPPGKGVIGKLMAEIAELFSVYQPKAPLSGREYIVCKDCGHVSILIH